MTEFSPAAQSILDALYMDELNGPQQLMARAHAAAALRAAADQVVPDYEVTLGGSKIWQSEPEVSIRAELLAIATELELL